MKLFTPMARTVLSLVFLTLGIGGLAATSAQAEDWVYMDLGEIIVTGNANDGYTYVPEAWDHLQKLQAAGFKVALLTNIPESWGLDCGDKFLSLQTFMAQRLHEPTAFPWDHFDAVVMPPRDRYRKPQPFMFLSALENACASGGRTLFVGEEANERHAAAAYGIPSYLNAAGEARVPTPEEATAVLDKGYAFTAPADCDFTSLYGSVLLPQDRAQGIPVCLVRP